MKFRTRLSLLFGGLLVVSLAIVLLLINWIARTSTQQRIEQSLLTTVFTVDSLHQQRIADLQQNLRLVAADYGFKTAYASDDLPTLQSALENHRNRLVNADLMMLCDLDGLVLSNTYSATLNGQEFPWLSILDQAYDEESGETTAFVILEGMVYQLIIAPLLAPDIDAWVISGFRVDKTTASRLSELTGSEISFIQGANATATLIASTLTPQQQQGLADFLQTTDIEYGINRYRSGDETHIGYFLPVSQTEAPQITAFVQRSLDQLLEPYRRLARLVLWLFLLSIVGFLLLIIKVSRSVTESITALSQAAEAISKGDLTMSVAEDRNDEIGVLSKTFNQMAKGLAEKEVVRDLLGKVVSPEIANELLSGGVELGGEERQITVLFCDIRGFTQLSETKSPAEVLAALNRFFTGVSGIIESNHGVVDKYIGDSVMALFGAPQEDPDHAMHAVNCANEMCRQAQALTQALRGDDAVDGDFGVGVHSGTVVAGNIGSTNRLNYTVIGDTVNVAARVQDQTRHYETRLIVTEATMLQCPTLAFYHLDSKRLKGRTEAVNLYSVV